MCGYCGCEDVGAIAELVAEHDAVVTLSGQARRALRAGALDVASARARDISAVLGPHTLVEEGALFPAMAAEYSAHVRDLVDEHRVIEEVLAESAAGTPTDAAWARRLRHALVMLREHILKEEDGFFPAALATLGPDEWDRVDAVRAQVSGASGQLAATGR